MNYFAHGIRYLDQPYMLAGTAVPDWLSVTDRRLRLRPHRVAPLVEQDGAVGEVARGVQQHCYDDGWFHRTPAFIQTSGDLTRLFRTLLDGQSGFRSALLGHIVTELLLDAALIERFPRQLDRYYQRLEELDTQIVQAAVNRMLPEPTQRLAPFISLFTKEAVLRDYLNDHALWVRLNQVMKRVKLESLPEEMVELLSQAREVVRRRVDGLLPSDKFLWNR